MPTLQRLAKFGYWPIRVLSDKTGRIDLTKTGIIFAVKTELTALAAHRVIAHMPLKAGTEALVQCGRDIGLPVNALSAGLLKHVLKAILMIRAVRDAKRDRAIEPLNLGSCLLCAKVPSSDGEPDGTGCVHSLYDATYCFSQLTEANGQRAVPSRDGDHEVLAASRKVLLSEAALVRSYDRSLLLNANNSSGATQASAEAAHAAGPVRGATGDGCIGNNCEGHTVHKANRGLVMPTDFDVAKERSEPALVLATAQCRHLCAAKAVTSSTHENFALMYALIDGLLEDPAFTPAMFEDPEWPEHLRNKLNHIGVYDIGCRFIIKLEERFSLRYGEEETAKLRDGFLRRVGVKTEAELTAEGGIEPIAEFSAPESAAPEAAAPEAATPKEPTWRQKLAARMASIRSNRTMPGLPFDINFAVGAFHVWGHDWACQEINGQFRIPGTALTQGDGPETLNWFLKVRAAITRSLSREMLDASVELYMRYYNEIRWERFVSDLATRARNAHAKAVASAAQKQAFEDLAGRTFSTDETRQFRLEVRAAASSPAAKPDAPAISGGSAIAAAEKIVQATAWLDSLTAMQLFVGDIPADGQFGPSNPNSDALLIIHAGMNIDKANNFNRWNRFRVALALKAAAIRVCKLTAAHLAACRKEATTTTDAASTSLKVAKAVRATSIATEAKKLQAKTLTAAESEAGDKRHRLVKKWLLEAFRNLRSARLASSKHETSKPLTGKVTDAERHVIELMCIHNAYLVAVESQEAPLDVTLLRSSDFDMSTYITLVDAEATSTAGLSFRRKQELVHMDDMRARIQEEFFLLKKEVDHLPRVLRHVGDHLRTTIQQCLQRTGDARSDADTSDAFHASLMLAAVERQLKAHKRMFTNWECIPVTEDEPEMDPDADDLCPNLADDAASESGLGDVDSDDIASVHDDSYHFEVDLPEAPFGSLDDPTPMNCDEHPIIDLC
jgi:hypothetical protein